VGLLLTGDSTQEAVIWTREAGLQQLADVVAANGPAIPSAWTLMEANAVSANGRWLAGTGRNPDGFEEAFLVDLQPRASSGGGSSDGATLVGLVALGLWRWRRRGTIPGTERTT
jgi:hypothetical protein